MEKETRASTANEVEQTNSEQDSNKAQTKPKGTKKKISIYILAALLLVLLGAAAAVATYMNIKPVGPAKNIRSDAPVSKSLTRAISFSAEGEVKLLDLTTKKTEVIDTAISPSSAETCNVCARNSDVSFDSKRVAMDYMGDGTNPSVGYYDRLSGKKVIIGPGYAPRWNTDGSALAYYDDEGVKVYTLNTQKITPVKDTGRTVDSSGVEGLPPLIYGWNAQNNLVFDDRKDSNDLTYSVVGLPIGNRTDYIIKSLSVDESLRDGTLSPDGTRILASVDRDPGYDTGVLNIDGSMYKSISGNTSPRWPGSGFFIAGWSDDNKSVVVRNQFYPADVQSSDTSKEKYEVRDIEGKNSYIIDSDRAQAPIGSSRQPSACWIGDKIYLIFASADGNTSYLGMFDVNTKKVSNIFNFPSTALSGLGCPTAN
jgi:hypothetical protein